MKRSGPPARRTPLAADPAKVRDWLRRSRVPLPARSDRGRERAAAAAKAGAEAKLRDGYRCQMIGLVPGVTCWGPLDPQHIIPRSTAPHLIDDLANLVAVCRGHHEWIGDHPAEARRLGFHGRAGDDLAALADRRALAD